MSKQKTPAATVRHLSDDVYEVPVTWTQVNPATRQYTIDTASIPSSTRRFTADAVACFEEEDHFRVFFLQRSVRNGSVRAALDVRVGKKSFAFFGETCRELRVDLSQPAEDLDFKEEPPTTIAVTASMVRTTQLDTGESQVDLFYLPPQELSKNANFVKVDSVARIDITRKAFLRVVVFALSIADREKDARHI